MRDAKTNASIASHFIEKALRALGTHRAWECPIHPEAGEAPALQIHPIFSFIPIPNGLEPKFWIRGCKPPGFR
jgi:hypothetical protein